MLHALLCLLPAIVVMLPLLARRYPGERVLLALRVGKRASFPRPRSSMSPRAIVEVACVRGGRLLGCSLAVRPPPAALRVS